MHELSIAMSIVEMAQDEAERRGVRVAVHLRLGPLSGVVADALLFCYEVASADTPLAGSRLLIEQTAVKVFCDTCGRERRLDSIQDFSCKICGRPTPRVRRGRNSKWWLWRWFFVENVGNLVCPSSYDLGEDLRLVLMSVTEGEDKPLKYPTIFNSADVAVLTKMDLAGAVEFDRAAAERNIRAVRPGMPILAVSAKTGLGMEEYFEFLALRKASKAHHEVAR